MPKVIKDLRNNILSVSKDELFNKGYKELNMRNIAKRTNTAVGTIYNYFNSKEMLVASIILEDWYKSTDEIKSVTDRALSIEEGLKGILKAISSFYSLYGSVFQNSGLPNIKITYPDKYEMLNKGIGEEIIKLMNKFNSSYDDFEITFIVSNIFSSVTNNWPLEQTINILNKIIKE